MKTLPNQAVMENLENAGCSSEDIEQFCRLARENRRPEQLRLLSRHRRLLLEEVHQCQRKLDCLDFLVYRMRKE